jgi:hypothetical protein
MDVPQLLILSSMLCTDVLEKKRREYATNEA